MKTSQQLHDIYGLEPISGWSLAPGWWWFLVMGIFLLIVWISFGLWRRHRQHVPISWQQEALQEWFILQPTENSLREQLVSLSTLLRRVAIQRYGRETCASLNGNLWLAWLTDHDPKGFDWNHYGHLLIEIPYQPPNLTINKEQVHVVYQAIYHWIMC